MALATNDFLRYSPEYNRLVRSSPEYDSEMIEHFFEQVFQNTGKSEINRHLRQEVMSRFQVIGEPELDRLLELEMKSQRSCKIDGPKVRWLSPTEISETFQGYIQELEQPECYQALKSIFDLDRKTKLTQCICLGLGSFATGVGNFKNTSLHQLAVLTVILRILGASHSIKKVYFQDPVFTQDERAFLRSLGFKVLENPAACSNMSTNTFVFAPFLGWNVIADAFKVAFPALFVGVGPATYLDALESQRHFVPEDNTLYFDTINILRRFTDITSVGTALPKFDKESWTEGTTVHWLSPAYGKAPEGRSKIRAAKKIAGKRVIGKLR